MSKPFYQQFVWAEYHRDTAHLRTAAEHGAYLLLIGALFTRGGKLPADDDSLARHACCTTEEWAGLKGVVLAFFQVRRGVLRHKRVTNDLRSIIETRSDRSRAGKLGGLASGRKRKGNSPAPAAAPAAAKAKQNEHSQSHSYTPEDKSSGTPDPDKDAWDLAGAVLTEQGGMDLVTAKRFFGALLARNDLKARELFTACASARVNQTRDPKTYLSSVARKVAERQVKAGGKPKDAGFC